MKPLNSWLGFLRYLIYTAALPQDYSCVHIQCKEESGQLFSPALVEQKYRPDIWA